MSISRKIYLASTSPRRRSLLTDIGFSFNLINPLVDEIEIRGESPRKMVARLAREKADAAMNALIASHGSGIVIAADTTVVAPGGKKTLGKPADALDAQRMLKILSGKTHTVLTGYSLGEVSSGKIIKRFDRTVSTQVKMRKLPLAKIAEYVFSGEPMDKAGAYAAQGIGTCLIESIKGSYTNVVGLPLAELVEDLELKFGISPIWRT